MDINEVINDTIKNDLERILSDSYEERTDVATSLTQILDDVRSEHLRVLEEVERAHDAIEKLSGENKDLKIANNKYFSAYVEDVVNKDEDDVKDTADEAIETLVDETAEIQDYDISDTTFVKETVSDETYVDEDVLDEYSLDDTEV